MRYEVLVTENPIDIVKAEKLRALGLVVPFIPSDEEFNIYAYIPEGADIDKDKINAIHYFDSLHQFITEEELQRYDLSIKAFNSVEIGDKVAIKGYKKLITTVVAVKDNEVTPEINLRGYIYRFHENIERVSKAEIIYPSVERDFKDTYDCDLYVDCDPFSKIDQEFTYVHSLFYFLLRLKLSYSRMNVILVNPRFDFHKTFGFGAYFGSKELLPLETDDYLYTEDLTIYEPSLNIITKQQVRNVNHLVTVTPYVFKQITGLQTSKQLKILNRLLEIYKNSKRIISIPKMKSDILFDADKVMKLNHIKPKDLNYKTIPLQRDNASAHFLFDMNECFRYLLEKKFINIAENIDYYMTILKG